MGRHIVSRSLVISAMVLGLVALTVPAAAQTGQVRGKVTDAENKPVEGAKVTIQQLDNGLIPRLGRDEEYRDRAPRRPPARP